MEWEKIKENYPNAIESLFNWLQITEMESDEDYDYSKWGQFKNDYLTANENFSWDCRNLFEFFDEQNLNVIITADYYKDGINWCWQIFWVDLSAPDYMGGTMSYGDNNEYPTRPESEKAAFEKAFELLEIKLNK